MELSKEAINKLRQVLENDLGIEYTKVFSNDDLDVLGMFLLTLTAEALKQK